MFTTITQAERDPLGVSQLPDSPQITAAKLKELIDSLGNLAIDKFITHINEITDTTAAGNIGAVIPDGYNANENLQSLIDEIVTKLGTALMDRHNHANKETLDAISAEQKQSYDDLVALMSGKSIQTTLSDNNAYIPTSHAVADYTKNAINNANYVKPNQVTDMVYPVGTIYQTTSQTFNPSSKFGGTWVQKGTASGVISYERTL
jgi:hypothetical protein